MTTLNLRDRARFAHIAAPLVREANGIRLGLSDRVARIIAEAEDTDEFVVQRCRQSGYHVESSIVQQETVAVQWHEGLDFINRTNAFFFFGFCTASSEAWCAARAVRSLI